MKNKMYIQDFVDDLEVLYQNGKIIKKPNKKGVRNETISNLGKDTKSYLQKRQILWSKRL